MNGGGLGGGGGAAVSISDIPPASPVPGQLWWDSGTGVFAVAYNDGNSQQWVQLNGKWAPPLPPPPTGAALLLVDETDGFAADFTLDDVVVKIAGEVTSHTVAEFFTQAGSRGAGVFALSGAGLAVNTTDDIRFPKTAIPYSATAGSWVVNLTTPSAAFPNRLIGYDTSNAAPLMMGADGVIYTYPTPGYYSATTETGATYVTGAKVAAAYDAAGCRVLITGAPITTTTDVMVTVGSLIFIGSVSGGNQMIGTIRTVKYVPRKMPNAELITETT